LSSTGADSQEPEVSCKNQIKLPNTRNCFKTRIENLMLNSFDYEIKTEITNQNKIPLQMNEILNPNPRTLTRFSSQELDVLVLARLGFVALSFTFFLLRLR
jgi:hypothetical protein